MHDLVPIGGTLALCFIAVLSVVWTERDKAQLHPEKKSRRRSNADGS